jgi:hypothetical protein
MIDYRHPQDLHLRTFHFQKWSRISNIQYLQIYICIEKIKNRILVLDFGVYLILFLPEKYIEYIHLSYWIR